MKQCTAKCDLYSFIYLLLLVRSLEELFSLMVTWSIGQFHDCTGYLFPIGIYACYVLLFLFKKIVCLKIAFILVI